MEESGLLFMLVLILKPHCLKIQVLCSEYGWCAGVCAGAEREHDIDNTWVGGQAAAVMVQV